MLVEFSILLGIASGVFTTIWIRKIKNKQIHTDSLRTLSTSSSSMSGIFVYANYMIPTPLRHVASRRSQKIEEDI